MQAISLTRRVMWYCRVVRFFIDAPLFEFSDCHFGAAEPWRTSPLPQRLYLCRA
jgi:hypothetical protein